nr:hypothetical protein CFP56_03186 [Quercus suber]
MEPGDGRLPVPQSGSFRRGRGAGGEGNANEKDSAGRRALCYVDEHEHSGLDISRPGTVVRGRIIESVGSRRLPESLLLTA